MGSGASKIDDEQRRKSKVKMSAVTAFSQPTTPAKDAARLDLPAPDAATPRAAPTPRRMSVVHPPEHPSHLMAACRRDPDAAVEMLDGPVGKRHVNHQAPHDASTPLHTLCWHHDRPDIIKQLLARAADPGLRNRYSITPLMNAANQGHEKTVDLLLGLGVDTQHAAARALACGHNELARRIEESDRNRQRPRRPSAAGLVSVPAIDDHEDGLDGGGAGAGASSSGDGG